MPEFVKGQRVRVSYEAEYRAPFSDGRLQVEHSGGYGIVPSDATVEAVAPPQPEEPKAPGSVVEVRERRLARVDDDDIPWKVAGGPSLNGDWYFAWSDLTDMGPVKVLFDPDSPVETATTDPHPPVTDSDGDTWRWLPDGEEGAGYYLHGRSVGLYRPSRDKVLEDFGIET